MSDFPTLPSNLRIFKYIVSDNSIHMHNQNDFGVFSKHEFDKAKFNVEKAFQSMSSCQNALCRRVCFISEISKRHCVYSFTLLRDNLAYTFLLSTQLHAQNNISKQLDECAKALSFVEKIKKFSSESSIFTINDCLSKHINQLLCLKRIVALKTDACKDFLELNILTKTVCDYLNQLYKGKINIHVDALAATAAVNPQIYSAILVYTTSQLSYLTDDFEINIKVGCDKTGSGTLTISTNTNDAEKAKHIKPIILRAFDGVCETINCDFKKGVFCITSTFKKPVVKQYKVGTPKFDQKLYDIQTYKDILSDLSFVSYI